MVMTADDIRELMQTIADAVDLSCGMRIEENLCEEVVIFAQKTTCNGHVLLEGGTRSILWLHDASEGKSGNERNTQRVSDGLVMLLERIVVDIEFEAGIDTAEELLALGVTLLDDDRIVLAQVAQVGESGTKHRVCRNERMT